MMATLLPILPLLIGGLVVAVVVLVFLAFGNRGEERAAERLDVLVGRNVRKDSSADMLLKQALQEQDKRTFLDRITPGAFNLTKVFEQADVNTATSTTAGTTDCSDNLGILVLL